MCVVRCLGPLLLPVVPLSPVDLGWTHPLNHATKLPLFAKRLRHLPLGCACLHRLHGAHAHLYCCPASMYCLYCSMWLYRWLTWTTASSSCSTRRLPHQATAPSGWPCPKMATAGLAAHNPSSHLHHNTHPAPPQQLHRLHPRAAARRRRFRRRRFRRRPRRRFRRRGTRGAWARRARCRWREAGGGCTTAAGGRQAQVGHALELSLDSVCVM